MNPYDEQRLRNEVMYLHSLWHQGPPHPQPHPQQNPIHLQFQPYTPQPFVSRSHQPTWHLRPHQPQFPSSHTRSLLPVASTSFKKKNKKKKHKGNKDPTRDPGPEWPCPVRNEPVKSVWGARKPGSAPQTVSPEEKERLVALPLQHKACKTFKEFLLNHEDDDDGDGDDDDDDDVDGWKEFEEFFVTVFMEDGELRGYYQRNFESGEFCCLVCGGIGKKGSGKRYKGCLGLVQHSMSILRTVKKRAHRGFGLAMCKVLGWDVDRLPTIVMKGYPLGMEMKPPENEGEPKYSIADGHEGHDGSHKSNDKVVSSERGDKPVDRGAQEGDQSLDGCPSKEGVLNNTAENLDRKRFDIGSKNGGAGATSEVFEAEWVCKNPNCDSSSTASGWPSFNTRSSSQIHSLSVEEQASMEVLQMQHKALEACRKYLVGNAGSDCDEDDVNDDEDEDELIDDCDLEECEEFKLLIRLFTENSDLMGYYENNHREGDFYCLVCGGTGKKIWKRFKDCSSLLQHSTAIKRTKRKRAHRAYSLVICKVLGWDIYRLPAIVLKGESLGSSLAASTKLSGEPEKPADCHIHNSNLLQENQEK